MKMSVAMPHTRNDTSRIANAGVETGAKMLGVGATPVAAAISLMVCSPPAYRKRLTLARSTTSSPRPLSTALSMKRLKPVIQDQVGDRLLGHGASQVSLCRLGCCRGRAGYAPTRQAPSV